MSVAASAQLDQAAPSVNAMNRAAINRANSQHSTGPRTRAGKQRSSKNALRHGLTARSAVLPTEDETAYQQLCQKFFNEYKPATATETTLVQLLADTSWRLGRVTKLEDDIVDDISLPPQAAIEQISKLGLYSSRLSRQFQNAIKQLRDIQDHRRQRERQELLPAAGLLVHHEKQEKPSDPVGDGFVFSRSQVEQFTSAALDATPQLPPANHRFQAHEQIA